MKKIFAAVLVAMVAVSVLGDTATVSLSVTGGQAVAYSAAIPASGLLDKIEVAQGANQTSTVVIASYSGATAIETLASLTTWNTSTKLVIPRRVGTTTAGVSVTAAAVAGSDATTNTSGTVLAAAYEAPVIGGNTKMAVTVGANQGVDVTNTVTATIYYTPLKK